MSGIDDLLRDGGVNQKLTMKEERDRGEALGDGEHSKWYRRKMALWSLTYVGSW